MRILSIGRADSCNIVVTDEMNRISRNHAILRIHAFGKMEIVGCGSNGTFVNGRAIKNGVPVPVTRKDHISFAHERDLDWSLIKSPYYYVRFAFLVILGAAIIWFLVSIIINLDFWQKTEGATAGGDGSGALVSPQDSLREEHLGVEINSECDSRKGREKKATDFFPNPIEEGKKNQTKNSSSSTEQGVDTTKKSTIIF